MVGHKTAVPLQQFRLNEYVCRFHSHTGVQSSLTNMILSLFNGVGWYHLLIR